MMAASTVAKSIALVTADEGICTRRRPLHVEKRPITIMLTASSKGVHKAGIAKTKN